MLFLEPLEARCVPAAFLSGNDLIIEGDASNNTISVDASNAAAVSVVLDSVNYGPFDVSAGQILADAGAGNDTLAFTGNHPGFLDMGTSTDTLVFDGLATLTVQNGGTLNGSVAFTSVENLTGGAGDDTLALEALGRLTGSFDGAGGINALNYSDWSATVSVNLGAGTGTNVNQGFLGVNAVWGGTGNDYLVGGSGNDALHGNGGHDILVGHGGNDTLRGGAGNDILIGGLGGDDIDGNDGDDILIGGTTSHDTSFSALHAIRKEWTQTYAAATRRLRILGDARGGFNGSYFFKAATVTDDGTADVLADTGASGLDWCWAFAGDTVSGNDLPDNDI